MRIAILGTGAVGGYFGGRLAEAGESVLFIARGATLETLRRQGLTVRSPNGELTVFPVEASDGRDRPAAADCALVAVKAWQVREAAGRLAELLAPGGFAVPLCNGVEAADDLAAVLGAARVLGGSCRILARVVRPGVVAHLGVEPTIVLGELDDSPSERLERLAAALRGAGVAVIVPPSIRAALWEKLVFIAATSGVGAVSRATVGEIRSLPETRALLAAAMREAWSVARGLGFAVREDAVEAGLAFFDKLPAEGAASMQRDLLEGRPSELEAQVGAVVRFGREVGVSTPVFDYLYASLLPQEMRARGGEM